MSLFRKKEDDEKDLFSPDHIGGGYLYPPTPSDKFWNGVITAIFVLLAVFITIIVIQAAF